MADTQTATKPTGPMHALYGASSSKIWMTCSGAPQIWQDMKAKGLPEPERSSYADLGTLAHLVAEHTIKSLAMGERHAPPEQNEFRHEALARLRLTTSDDIQDEVDFWAKFLSPAGDLLPEDCCDAVALHVNLVVDIVTNSGVNALYLEQRIDLSGLYESYSAEIDPAQPGQEHRALFGTADVMMLGPDELIVVDYKNGSGVPVHAAGNHQLKYYALGAYMSLPPRARQAVKGVRWVVTQPRVPGADETNFWSSDYLLVPHLLAFGAEIVAAVERAEGLIPNDPPELVPGEHCRFCRAAGCCPALASRAQAMAKKVFADLPATPPSGVPSVKPLGADGAKAAAKALTDHALGHVLRDVSLVEKFFREAKDEALRRLLSGRTVPGFRAVTSRTLRGWTDEEAVTELLVTRYGHDADMPPSDLLKPRSPAHLTRVLGGLGNTGLLDLVREPEDKPALGGENDKRKPFARDAGAAFPDDLSGGSET